MELLFYLTIPGTSVLYSYAEVVCMKISEIIARVDGLKPNKYSAEIKLDWINRVDGMIWDDVYQYTDIAEIMRQQGVSAYDLPQNIKFEMVKKVYVDGRQIYIIENGDIETTGYYRGTDGKLNIYPVPAKDDDTTPGLKIVYRLPFTPHASADEEPFMQPPFDKAYDDYIAAMIDKYNLDMEGYNNNVNFYNAGIKEYIDWYNRHKVQED